ncbi:Nif11-like leader peptide family natural product precursor [Aerosakkonema funiforme]|uniref:Nif11-like leader peptide family natural product n=1 Tax=Aerosakkonema funiforme FACHB-1375 TaxID=2949571 RepID=A0A926VEW2_9CYAN|nr:Nif11-like leader peptide family natural product precursor [Aerosakkonema funiforme]MBD2181938.1 Nif11-like leader peptide family natural product precursor [Aerosakkonema funiforme FACHB-1375]
MLQNLIQPINAEDLPAEELRFIKAQQAIYELCKAVEQDSEIKSQLETAKSPETFLEIAAENGYEFTILDMQFALQWAKEKTEINNDEFDDYELNEEELEMVAGGTIAGRAMSRNSYWHPTGICVNQQCFHLTYASTEDREKLEQALETMEVWRWKGNGTVEVADLNGIYGRYELKNMAYDGLAVGILQDRSGKSTYSSDSAILSLIV